MVQQCWLKCKWIGYILCRNKLQQTIKYDDYKLIQSNGALF